MVGAVRVGLFRSGRLNALSCLLTLTISDLVKHEAAKRNRRGRRHQRSLRRPLPWNMPAADAGLRVKSATVYTAENSFGKFPPLPVPLHIVPGGEHVAKRSSFTGRLVRSLENFMGHRSAKTYESPVSMSPTFTSVASTWNILSPLLSYITIDSDCLVFAECAADPPINRGIAGT